MKENRLGYVDVLNSEIKSRIYGKITVSNNSVELLITKNKKTAEASLKEATEMACVGQKGHIYEVILRKVT